MPSPHGDPQWTVPGPDEPPPVDRVSRGVSYVMVAGIAWTVLALLNLCPVLFIDIERSPGPVGVALVVAQLFLPAAPIVLMVLAWRLLQGRTRGVAAVLTLDALAACYGIGLTVYEAYQLLNPRPGAREILLPTVVPVLVGAVLVAACAAIGGIMLLRRGE